jgi:hypothetical protein
MTIPLGFDKSRVKFALESSIHVGLAILLAASCLLILYPPKISKCLSGGKGIIFPLQFMGNVIPQPDHEGKTVGGTGRSMLVKTIRMMQACQRSRDQTQIAKGQSER